MEIKFDPICSYFKNVSLFYFHLCLRKNYFCYLYFKFVLREKYNKTLEGISLINFVFIIDITLDASSAKLFMLIISKTFNRVHRA